MLARRLLAASGGSGSFLPPLFAVSGPYSPSFVPGTTVLTQVHCHTTGSDGTYSPATVVGYYASAGYGALVITDHDVVTAQPAGITTAITGNEHSPAAQHIIAINSDYARGAVTDAQTILSGIAADGGQAELAHPNWSIGLTYAEMAALTDYLGIEIHNSAVVNGAGLDPVTYPGYSLDRWKELLDGGRRDVWAFAVDDLHVIGAYTTYDVGRLKVFAASNSLADIMTSLVAGNFVADISNYGVTPGYPARSASGVSLTCPGAVRIEAWGAAGLLSATDADSHAHTFDAADPYVRLVAIGDYTEPFSSALSDRWYAVDGTWAATGGVLTVTGTTSAKRLILRRHRQGDFTAQVDARIAASGDTAALMFHVLDGTHWYMLRFGESSLSDFHNKLTFSKTTDGSFTNASDLAGAAFAAVNGTWYTIKMDYVASTGTMRAKVWAVGDAEPGTWAISATDTTWKHGGFGFRALGAEFDNLYLSGFQTFYQPISVDPA